MCLWHDRKEERYGSKKGAKEKGKRRGKGREGEERRKCHQDSVKPPPRTIPLIKGYRKKRMVKTAVVII